MGNTQTNIRDSVLTAKQDDIEITIKHFPIKKENSNIHGTLILNVIDPFKLLFLDPTS